MFEYRLFFKSDTAPPGFAVNIEADSIADAQRQEKENTGSRLQARRKISAPDHVAPGGWFDC